MHFHHYFCFMYINILVKSTSTSFVILFSRYLYHITIIVNVFRFLLQDETFKEFGQDSVCCQELNTSSVVLLCQDLWNEVCCHFFGLSCEDAKGEFTKFRRRIIQQELCEHHSRTQAVHLNCSLGLLLFISLYTLINFLHQTGSQLGQTSLCCTISSITRGSTAFHSTSNSVEDVSSKSILLSHDIHGHFGAIKNTQKIHLHDSFDLLHRQFRQSPSSSINTSIIDPISNLSELLLGKLAQFLTACCITHVTLGMKHFSIGMAGGKCFGGSGTILDVADYHVISAIHEFSSVGETDTTSGSSDNNSTVRHGIERCG
mmetsp:Transcript_31463/g.47398  ORF Transcript_31463/g.47398 Transcript_31463/m.47398 type:complete len:316 (-) Transcript_31463:162-1109(-)